MDSNLDGQGFKVIGFGLGQALQSKFQQLITTPTLSHWPVVSVDHLETPSISIRTPTGALCFLVAALIWELIRLLLRLRWAWRPLLTDITIYDEISCPAHVVITVLHLCLVQSANRRESPILVQVRNTGSCPTIGRSPKVVIGGAVWCRNGAFCGGRRRMPDESPTGYQ